jgi:predicted DNA-binding transcriptional regulator AlpA
VAEDESIDLVGIGEIGELLGEKRSNVKALADRRTQGFPLPVGTIGRSRVWRRQDVEEWAKQVGRLPEG